MSRIVHLVDDQSPGGVTQYLTFLTQRLAEHDGRAHQIVPVPRTRPDRHATPADAYVSHLTLSWRGLPGLMRLRANHTGTPIIHVEHSYTERFTALNVPTRHRFYGLLRCGYALCDRVVAVSQAQASWLRRQALVQPNALRVIRPVTNLAPFAALPPVDGPVRRIGALGRLAPSKGIDLLIKAFANLSDPDLSLQIFGDGPERDALMTLACSDDRVVFHGAVPGPKAISQIDLLAMPSRWESYGLVALEARAAGRPVLVSRADGLLDHIRKGAIAAPDMSEGAWTSALGSIAGKPATSLPFDHRRAEARCLNGWSSLLDEVSARSSGHQRLSA